MDAAQWYILGGVLLATGAAVLLTSQIFLAKWMKRFKQE